MKNFKVLKQAYKSMGTTGKGVVWLCGIAVIYIILELL